MFPREFTNNKVLQWALGALVFIYFIAFYFWIKSGATSVTTIDGAAHLCPPHWQSCESLYFLEALPIGYSQTFFYMLLFALLLWVVYLLAEKKWREAQLTLIPVFFWHAYNVFFATQYTSTSYEYYLVGYGLILLFLPHKEYFLKMFLVLCYVLSTVTKIHPAWIEGGYFTHLRAGLPLFPDWSIPLFSNLVILMEMVGSWFLLSKHRLLQRGALVFFIMFHLYSGIFVGYHYPVTLLPMLLIVFGPWYRHQAVPLDKKSIAGWLFILMLIVFQFIPKFISGDEKLTLEGNKYGLHMFESNHQCISESVVWKFSGDDKVSTSISISSRDRCNPYDTWFRLKEICDHDTNIERISWTLDHSINGDPFLRIVDTENVCDLEYKPFSHNEWIKTHDDNPEVIGWPVKNFID